MENKGMMMMISGLHSC